MRDHVIKALVKAAESDPRIMLVIADLGFNVVELFKDRYPDRFFNAGISEQNMTSVAAGLALEGNMAFTYSIGNFPTLRCIEQIRNLVCYHNANVKILAVGGGFAYGDLGMTHHATEDIAMMRALPNMRVYAPADAIEAVACFHDMIKCNDPCYLRMARGKEECIYQEDAALDVTRCIEYAPAGTDFNILVTGTIACEAVKLQKMITNEGFSCGAFIVPRIKPIDQHTICEIAQKSRYLISMEEHNIIGGLGGTVSEILSGLATHGKLLRFGLQDIFTSEVGGQNYLRDYYGMSAEKVWDKIQAMGYSNDGLSSQVRHLV